MGNLRQHEAFQREAKHGYYACVSYIDAQIGLVLDELERLGLAESTIVVILGDHGWHLGEHGFWGKHNLMNHATRAPLIVRVPHCKGGKAGGVVEFVDIYPTLCELCKVPVPEGQLQGKSFVPILQDSEKRIKEYAFVQWQGDSVVGRMVFDRQSDVAENENKVGSVSLSEEIKELETQIRIKKLQLEK